MEEKKEKKWSRFRITIGNKILAGFSALMILYIFNVLVIFSTRNTISTVLSRSKDIIRPSQEAINDFNLLVTRSKMLATNWVYLGQNESKDKEALRQLMSIDYPELRERIDKLKVQWEGDSQLWYMDSALISFERMLRIQDQEIMSTLVTFDSYEDPMTKLFAEGAINDYVIPTSDTVFAHLEQVKRKQSEATRKSDASIDSSVGQLRRVSIILAIVFLAWAMVSAFYLMKSITTPVNFLKNIITKLSKGELVEEKGKKFKNDEIGEMAEAMDHLVNGLKRTTLFAESIGNGDYSTEFKPLSENDVLGNALLEMRVNLAKVAEDDKARNWATEGTAVFGEILRSNSHDLELLSDQIISGLIKYLDANQGAIYIMDDEDHTVEDEEPTMSMKACYAWDKKKFIDQKIHIGEGLAGQAWQEGQTIYLTEIPQNYVKIVSGLGDSNPSSILIVPLKVNEEIFGVVEIASFHEFQPHQIEFVEKIAETIASTISNVKINAKTQHLLEDSQELTEQMRAQEEEMRQNMEELQATQEEMSRSQAETESTMQAISNSLSVAEYDIDGRITKINANYLELLGYADVEVVGEHQRLLVPKEDKMNEDYRLFWKSLAAGEPRKGNFNRLTKRGEQIFVYATFSPITNRGGEVIKIMEVAYELNKVDVLQDS